MYDDSLDRILEYAKELQLRDFRARMSDWRREYIELISRKPVAPADYDEEDWT
jgi:hypothetical protein